MPTRHRWFGTTRCAPGAASLRLWRSKVEVAGDSRLQDLGVVVEGASGSLAPESPAGW